MLNELRVLDLSDERGFVGGWMLAELGADVVAVEPRGGSAARRLGPFADDIDDGEHGLPWWAYARNKRSIVVDLTTQAGRETLRGLVAQADILIESQAPGAMAAMGLGYEDLATLNPALIYVSITPFGQDGPKANWAASDLTVLAAGGPLWLSGDEDRAPVRVTVPQAFAHAGAEAAAASMIAVQERHRSGRGQHVDISAQQAVTLATQSDIVSGGIGDPPMLRFAGGMKMGPVIIRLVYPAVDGYVSITHVFGGAIGPATGRLMERVCADGFCDEAMRDKDWPDYGGQLARGEESIENFEAAKAAVADWTSSKTKEQLLDDAMTHSLLIAPCATPGDALASKQLAERGFFREEVRPDGKGSVRMPGRFVEFSDMKLEGTSPAPSIGAHTEQVLVEWRTRATPLPAGKPLTECTARPLEGLKVLDFMWAIAGPMTTRILADYGATVIRIESSHRIDACRTMRPYVDGKPDIDQSGLFQSCNASKLMVSLDLSKPESRKVIDDLIDWADVVCESFAPGKLAALGWGYDKLSAKKPELIMLSTSLMGQTGPLSSYAGYGNLAAAIAGFFDLTGWSDRPPAGPFGAYTDYVSPKFNALSLMAALEHRRRTGRGQHIDAAQAEAGLSFIAPALLDATINGRVPTRAGNRDELYAPHGCYPCAGEDRWIALAIEGDAEWATMCRTLGCKTLATDERFATLGSRRRNADELDREIGNYTAEFEAAKIEAVLQQAKLAAHEVLGSKALVVEPQLNARNHFLPRGDGGAIVESSRTVLSRTPAVVRDGLPLLGRDNHEVLTEILGYDDEAITALAIAGALE